MPEPHVCGMFNCTLTSVCKGKGRFVPQFERCQRSVIATQPDGHEMDDVVPVLPAYIHHDPLKLCLPVTLLLRTLVDDACMFVHVCKVAACMVGFSGPTLDLMMSLVQQDQNYSLALALLCISMYTRDRRKARREGGRRLGESPHLMVNCWKYRFSVVPLEKKWR